MLSALPGMAWHTALSASQPYLLALAQHPGLASKTPHLYGLTPNPCTWTTLPNPGAACNYCSSLASLSGQAQKEKEDLADGTTGQGIKVVVVTKPVTTASPERQSTEFPDSPQGPGRQGCHFFLLSVSLIRYL